MSKANAFNVNEARARHVLDDKSTSLLADMKQLNERKRALDRSTADMQGVLQHLEQSLASERRALEALNRRLQETEREVVQTRGHCNAFQLRLEHLTACTEDEEALLRHEAKRVQMLRVGKHAVGLQCSVTLQTLHVRITEWMGLPETDREGAAEPLLKRFQGELAALVPQDVPSILAKAAQARADAVEFLAQADVGNLNTKLKQALERVEACSSAPCQAPRCQQADSPLPVLHGMEATLQNAQREVERFQRQVELVHGDFTPSSLPLSSDS